MSTILILSNKKEIFEFISDVIENIGYIPIISRNTTSGFKMIKEEKPNCIILDIDIVNNVEIELFSLIKSIKSLKNIPLVTIVPENTNETTILSILKSGTDEYIKIPIKPIELQTLINVMLKLKTSNDEIEWERQFISKILDSTESFIFVTDFNFQIIRYNSHVSDFFYFTKDLLRQNFLDLAFPKTEYKINIKKTLELFIKSDSKIFHPEIILTKLNNIEYPYRWTITKEYDAQIDKDLLIFVGQDMSETRRYETMIESLLADSKLKNMQLEEVNALLEIKNKELSELNTLKTEYISIASHDLRSPISQIMAMAQLLLKNKPSVPTEWQKKLIERILESAEFQLSLVSDILDITRVETGYIKLDLELNDINSLIIKSVESVKELTVNKGIKINVYGLEELRFVKLDSLKIQQVINNLIGNAVKFTYENGEIDVYVDIENDMLIVKIKDTGIGIAKENVADIFKKFAMHRKNGTIGEKGTGLGLSICKKLIELHNGEIGVNSELGKGSTFYFKVPVS